MGGFAETGRRGMKRFIVTSSIIIGLSSMGVAMAANPLSDRELEEVSGGAVDVAENDQQPQQSQQPQQPQTDTHNDPMPTEQIKQDDGMDLSPELFAVLQSSINSERERKVTLQGASQQGITALNVENVISSDAVAANNIFNGEGLLDNESAVSVEVNQLNSIHQSHRRQGSFSSSLEGHRYETTIESYSASEDYNYRVFSSEYKQRISTLQRSDFSEASSHVGTRYTSLNDLTSDTLPLSILPTDDFEPRLFDFPQIGDTLKAGWFGEYGATLDYNGLLFTGLGLDLDSIRAGGSGNRDLIIGTTVTTPKLDFGDLDIKACIAKCTQLNWDLGYIGGDQIHPNIVLNGIAPDIQELNFGSGFAYEGSGSLNPTAGVFSLDGTIGLRITPHATLTLDFSKMELLKVNVGDALIKLEVFPDGEGGFTDIISNTWSFDLLNGSFDFKLYEDEIEIEPMDIVAGDIEHTSDEILIEDYDTREIYDAVDVASSHYDEFYQHTVFIGGDISGVEAELLAMSEGDLTVNESSVIALSQSAQKNMRILNVVNASSSIAANALNISRLPVMSGARSGVLSTNMRQQNHFIQQH